MFKIGDVVIENDVIMAPLAGITNVAFRTIIKEFNVGLVVSELISDKAIYYGNEKTLAMLEVHEDEHPMALQLFGSEVETMVYAAKYLDEKTDCDIIDINMGCPVNKVVKTGAGSALMTTPQLAYDIVKAVVDNVSKPVTVKIRKGFDNDHVNAVEIAKLCEKAGAKMIAVHGRTRNQMYEGKADWSIIKAVKQAVSIPVVGNGDIRSVQDALDMKAQTGCDAVMIGRGALGNPWLIKQVVDAFNGQPVDDSIGIVKRIEQCLKHAQRLLEIMPENIAMAQMRGHGPWYLKGLPNTAVVKNALAKIETYEQLESILEEYQEYLSTTKNQ